MVEPTERIGPCSLYLGDCRDVLPVLPEASLVIADPPYNGVLDDSWDNEWSSDGEFLSWMGSWLSVIPLAANGSVYVFCTPRLAAQVEVEVSKTHRVIGSLIWDKSESRMGAAGSGVDVTSLRTYWHASTERIVFAEQKANGPYREADDAAKDASGYWSACEATKRAVFGDYLRAEFARAGVTNKQVAALFPSRTGGLTGCVSNWLLGMNCPTSEQWQTMRDFLNRHASGDFLRREYEDLRREYEDLRRPFFLTKRFQWGDVWRFDPPRDRSHPAEKPLRMIRQMVVVSSRADDVVLAPFMGSGTDGVACVKEGRRFIGIEKDPQHFATAVKRIREAVQADRESLFPAFPQGAA